MLVGARCLSCGNRALLCCELQGLLGNLKLIPDQEEVQDATMPLAQYVSKCKVEVLQNLAHHLQFLEVRPGVSKHLGECRYEDVEVNKHFPQARKMKNSSLAAKNFCQGLPKVLKSVA